MPLDGIFLHSVIHELKHTILNSKVIKINQPEKDEIILSLKNNSNLYKLVISASSNYPRIHLTKTTKPNPNKAPLFCMILRKYLASSTIFNIRQLDTDRIIIIDFKCTDSLGFNSVYSLIVEIMGRHSNITLIRNRDKIIMDCIKHISSDVNTYRILSPGVKYTFPPKSNKINPLNYTYKEYKQYDNLNNIPFSSKYFSTIFMGVSKQLSEEMYYMYENFSKNNIDYDLYNFSLNFFNKIKNNADLKYCCYFDNKNNVFAFHCIPLTYLKQKYVERIFNSPSELLDYFYNKKDKLDRIKSRSISLQKLINTNLERCSKKIKILDKALKECETKDTYRLYGELLTANIYKIKKGMSNITINNYYTNKDITIPLDANKTPSQNIQKYFKKYNKLKTTEKMAKVQKKLSIEEKNYLESVLTNLENCEDYESIQEIKNELVNTGYIKYRKSNSCKKNNKKINLMHFKSSDGYDIYVGKNNMQNDYLTLKFANKNDIWLHTKKIHGSHVIIRNNGNISEKCLEEAAIIAAYYSKARNSSKVPVDYTEVKNVKKPSGAKPGMVIYYTNKTIYVNPKKPSDKSID